MPRTVFALLLLLLAAPAHALGLGSAQLQSWLGQPLKITVALVPDGGAPPDIGCFSLSSTGDSGMAPPSDAALRYNTAGNALVVTSRSPVQSLALEFAIAADCRGSRMTRDYSLLLDPPPAITPAAMAQANPATPTAPPAAKDVVHGGVGAAATRLRAAAGSRPPRRTRRAALKARPAASRPLRRFKPARTRPPAPTPAQRPSEPRLSLSGGSNMLDRGGLVLHLDTTLSGLRPPPPAAAPAPASLEAQAAALRQTLNGLQKELDQLRKRNAELQARVAAPPPLPPAPRRTIGYGWIATGLALLLAAALVAWELHRRQRARQASAAADWESLAATLPTLKVALPTEASGDWCELPQVPPPPDARLAEPPAAAGEPQRNHPPPAKRPPSRDVEAYPFHGRRTRDTGTEINESAVDKAEVFLAHGHAGLAIHLLEEHLAENPTESPVPWLLLLELLEREGLKKEYNVARLSCKVHFNLQVADLDESTGTHSLEDFPHILAEVEQRWSSAESVPYLDSLLRGPGFRDGAVSCWLPDPAWW